MEVKQLGLEEQLGKQHFHYNAPIFFEPITKTVEDTNQKLLEESEAKTKALDDVNENFRFNTALNEDILKNEEERDPIPIDTVKTNLCKR